MHLYRHSIQGLSQTQVRYLCTTLWSWIPCSACDGLCACSQTHCPYNRLPRLTSIFQHYSDTCSIARLELKGTEHEGTLRHEVILSIVNYLKHSVQCTRTEIHRFLGDKGIIDVATNDVAINVAVKIMTMINCSSDSNTTQLLEQGLRQPPWHDGISFADFVYNSFPSKDYSTIDDIRDAYCGLSSGRMSARKLIKHARITLRPTSDIRSHLHYDRATNTLDIFYHTAFLKEQLRLTYGQTLTTAESLGRGALPRLLVLEVLDSIQKILFPLDDTKSYSLLRSFITRHSLDTDCLRFDSMDIRQDHESDISYRYLETRLLALYEVSSNLRPQRAFEKWLERRSGARYVMMATIAGIAFAIFLGMATLAVSIVQTYIAYQAWKHPVQ